VQAVVRLVFRKFAELGTLHGVLHYLAAHQIQLGVRVRECPGKGAPVWRRPDRMTLQLLLSHLLNAGTYVYGRRQDNCRRRRAGRTRSGRVVAAREDWLTLVPDGPPVYLSWERHERNQAQLAANRPRTESRGAVRSGRALLAGVVRCGRCGRRLIVRYESARAGPAYMCARHASDYGAPH
jgi:hypothetical protein